MIVSWNWLKQYVQLDMPVAELVRRLMLAGFNHEGTEEVGGDLAIDLEITSNRPDCLGHIGVAREVAVLWNRPLAIPAVELLESGPDAASLCRVSIQCPQMCPRYTARIIRGVRVAESPWWLRTRLATLGIPSINNVVDITNYVLMECGQPLHAFDLRKLAGPEIIVRPGRPGETLVAIDHRQYAVGPETCVIADARHAVAIGGVMGGADSEVGSETVDLLIESAAFDPVCIRNTARRLNLHSASSYRFERPLDPAGVDWASRRACALILELAGGELARGVLAAGEPPPPRPPILLRLAQLERVLGISIDQARVREILTALGNRELRATPTEIEVQPPTWRSDLAREIDLIEEVARIHGYDAIPEDRTLPMAPSLRSREDRVLARIRDVLTALGYDEALTLSAVEADHARDASPWTDAEPLASHTPVLRRANRLRTSLLPSLLLARHTNEALANSVIELFEIARAYLPRNGELPQEELLLGLASGGDFYHVKGAVEAVLEALVPQAEAEVRPSSLALLDPVQRCELWLAGERLAVLGCVGKAALERFELRSPTTVAELRLAPLIAAAVLTPRGELPPAFPAIEHDLNLVVAEAVRWADLAQAVRASGGVHLERVVYKDTYRDPKRVGEGKKSVLFSITLRSRTGTLTSLEAEGIRHRIVSACQERFGAALRGT